MDKTEKKLLELAMLEYGKGNEGMAWFEYTKHFNNELLPVIFADIKERGSIFFSSFGVYLVKPLYFSGRTVYW